MAIVAQSTMANVHNDILIDAGDSGVSCSECRRRKVKCGRELPTCAACIKFDFECIYSGSTHKRHNRLKLDNMSKISFGGVKRPCPNTNLTFKLVQYLPIHGSQENSMDFCHQDLVKYGSGPKFNPHLTIMLLGQILEKNPWIGTEVDWFLNNVKLGIFGGVIAAHIKLDNSWIKELYNPNFREHALNNYFQFFHPWFSYFGKRLFYARLNLEDSVLLPVLIFVGYQYMSNHHKELLKYLEHMAIVQLRKNMYKVSITNLQALYIFSYSMLLRGLAKQSLPYYNQACRMGSALGIQLNIRGLAADIQNERECIRSISTMQEQHLISTLNIPTYLAGITHSPMPMDPVFQIVHYEASYAEVVEAECISMLRWIYDQYWMVVTSEMHALAFKQEIKKVDLSSDELQVKCDYFGKLYDKCLVISYGKFLELTNRFNTPEAKQIIEKYIKIFTCNYYQWIILLYSQQKPSFDPLTQAVDYHTQRALTAVKNIFKLVTTSYPSTLYLYYHYLSGISFFYLNLYLNTTENPLFQYEIKQELSNIYLKFKAYKEEYSFSNDYLLALVEILKFLKISV
ncbi:hypothetical protein CONCODRAFT_2980 [Conidiobolus coronatus NRRL 28638]|uniref:Zn(2)-C6 fungal-type domain-containing protein n=1 Tax=Conidiobolus coronatus (strain ATCC 28846 / CBS 209.66 / NRRL 28638) TaxID=796925 RepID=A0A137PGG0_CONC2|nr:hypothetical protein CONCODRAFT_2980 [Conidiobolus coronatus NRRL 28638]|eukprot:KXN74086.1 hypothetical protein CONCODRAFT_2980 [Conidiobolus coronatus NRRL 28638]